MDRAEFPPEAADLLGIVAHRLFADQSGPESVVQLSLDTDYPLPELDRARAHLLGDGAEGFFLRVGKLQILFKLEHAAGSRVPDQFHGPLRRRLAPRNQDLT